ncbi:MAG: DUF5030 domain-containing protein [Bacteroides sp.]|nr:DUF5030 domain-containing protein [Bacteroides sp.]MCM1447832.1 DUF5030 domain-containing protein [Bacteroides sp.]
MKTFLSITLTILSITGVYGQKPQSFSYLEDKWHEYQRKEAFKPNYLHRYFKDSVSVEEMKEAFAKYKNDTVLQGTADYGEYDVVQFIGGANSAMIVSPLRLHPKKEIKECHAVWYEHDGNITIKDVKDKSGASRKDLADKLNKERANWLNGDAVTLKRPSWYMGFVVSADPCLHIYDKGEQVCGEKTSAMSYPDFFSYASIKGMRLAGYTNWTYAMYSGAQKLGVWHNMLSDFYPAFTERTFSVLLHACPKNGGSKAAYTIELFEPEKADKETMVAFNDFKQTIELIPANAFKPYYTTDFRIMTGRYYSVTVNKYGWLVEDYFSIN